MNRIHNINLRNDQYKSGSLAIRNKHKNNVKVFHLSICSKNVTKLIMSIKCKYLKLNQINLQELSQDVFRIRPNDNNFLAKLIL